jgi:drug/metabolite transporter (DMT)-like permease
VRSESLSGMLFMVFGIASFAGADAIGKWMVADYSVFQVLLVRSISAVLVLVALAPIFGGREVARTSQPWAHLARSLCSTLAFLFFFASVRFLPLADAVAVEFGGPFLVMALSVPILGERIDRGRWLAVVAGFAGMLLIVQPTGRGIRPEALLILASSFSYAFMMVLTRWMARRTGGEERTFTFLVYTMSLQLLVGLAGAFLSWREMTGFDLALTLAMGVFALGGQFGVTAAFQKAPASVVAPFEYTALVWATFFGVFIYGDFPAPPVWIGVAVIVAAGLYTLRRENATP